VLGEGTKDPGEGVLGVFQKQRDRSTGQTNLHITITILEQ